MTADVFPGPHAHNLPGSIGPFSRNQLSTPVENGLLSFSDPDAISSPEAKGNPAIFLRKLPRNSDHNTVRSMLLFCGKDLIDCEVHSTPRYAEDKGFVSAVARFRTLEAAKEARDLLDGKLNASNDANMIVELVQESSPGAIGSRRNTVVDNSAPLRQGSISTPSGISTNITNGRQSSRYNGTFQNMEKISPQNGTPGLGNGDPTQNAFSPTVTSPVVPAFNNRNLGKSVINNEAADDEDNLLNESIGFATSGQQITQPLGPRRPTNPSTSIPVSRFNSLSLTTNGINGMNSPPIPSFASPRSAATIQSPGTAISAMSPHTVPSGMGNPYHQFSQHHTRAPFMQPPQANPADQNPPCNTLYVGNLPLDTSEDELKHMFSKQRGYKRLCFRTKANGPMCFVEFEDVSFATKALNDLYGHPLHNSVKGGIRLSFSKNPLGVRNGQAANNLGSTTNLPPATGFGGAVTTPLGFTTATGPPPGLSAPLPAPPGIPAPIHTNSPVGYNLYQNGTFGMASEVAPLRNQPLPTPHSNGNVNGYGGSNGTPHPNGIANGYSGSNGTPLSNGSTNGFGGSNGNYAYFNGR